MEKSTAVDERGLATKLVDLYDTLESALSTMAKIVPGCESKTVDEKDNTPADLPRLHKLADSCQEMSTKLIEQLSTLRYKLS